MYNKLTTKRIIFLVALIALFVVTLAFSTLYQPTLNNTPVELTQTTLPDVALANVGSLNAKSAYHFNTEDISNYNSNSGTVTLDVGSPSLDNIAWSYSCGDYDYSMTINKETNCDMQIEKFKADKGYNFGNAVLNLEIPQFVKNLLSSGTVNIRVLASYQYEAHMLGTVSYSYFYMGYKRTNQLLTQLPVTLSGKPNEKDYSLFLGDFEEKSNDDWWIFDNSLSLDIDFNYNLTADDSYLALGIACANQDTGAPAPRVGLYNVRLVITYNGSVDVSVPSNGTFSYKLYENATYTSLGTPTKTGTTNALKQAVGNPFVALEIEPIESTPGYRIDSVVSATSYTYNFGNNGWGNDLVSNRIIYIDACDYSRPADETNRNTAASNTQAHLLSGSTTRVNFVARTVKLIYVSNYDKNYAVNGADATIEHYVTLYNSNAEHLIKNAKTIFTGTNSFSSGWRYTDYSTNAGAGYYELETPVDLTDRIQYAPPFDIVSNRCVFRMHANWVDATATDGDDYFTISASQYDRMYSDVTYTLTYNRQYFDLINVYAYYTSGDLAGTHITLDPLGNNKWKLYGISGNCTLVGEWLPQSFTPTYNVGEPKSFTPIEKVYVYKGVSAADMPTCVGNGNWMFIRWNVSGDYQDGQPYNGLTHIPAGAKSAHYVAEWVETSTCYRVTDFNQHTVDEWSSDGVIFPSGRQYDHKRDGVPEVYSVANNNYKFGGLTGIVVADAQKQNRELTGYPVFIPVYFAGQLRQDIIDGKVTKVNITASADLYAGAGRLEGGAYFSSSHTYFDVWEGCTRDLALSTNGSASNEDRWRYVSSNFSGSTESDNLDLNVKIENVGSGGNTYSGDYFYEFSTSSKLQIVSDNKSKTFQIDVTPSTLGFTIGMLVKFWNSTINIGKITNHFGMMKNVKYQVTAATSDYNYNKAILNSNAPTGSSKTLSITQHGTNPIGKRDAFWSYEGYEFLGWSTTRTSTTGDKNMLLNGSSSGITYYAIWQKQNFPILSYNLYVGDDPEDPTKKAYAAEVRKAYYYKYGSGVITGNGSEAYFIDGNYSYVRQGSGGLPTSGFTYQGTWFIGDNTAFTSLMTCNWTWSSQSPPSLATTNSSSINATLTTESKVTVNSTTSYRKAIYVGFYYTMDAPTVTMGTVSPVNYGYSINLTSAITASGHGAQSTRDVKLTYTWLNSKGQKPSFYIDDQPILYTVKETDGYKVNLQADITIYGTVGSGVTLARNVDSSVINCAINALVLKLVVANGASNVLTYNGTIQQFPYVARLDESAYTGLDATELAYLQSVVINEHNGYAWYYNSSANNSINLGFGLIAKLIALQYQCALGTISVDGQTKNIYAGYTTITQSGTNTEFYAAGKYSVDTIILRKVNQGTETDTPNTNFVWSKPVSVNPQQHSADSTIYAEITPAQLDIYAVYSRKVFGTISEPSVTLLDDHYSVLGGSPLNGNTDLTTGATSYVAFDGMLGNDAQDYLATTGKYYDSLIDCWSRESGHTKGRYAIFFNVLAHVTVGEGDSQQSIINPDFYPLLNNYGITINATTDNYAKTNGANGGGIRLYRVNNVNDTNTPDDYTDDVFMFDTYSVSAFYDYCEEETSIPDSYKVFEILPLIMSAPALESSGSYTYDGTAHGPQYSFSGMDIETGSDIEDKDRQTEILGISIPEGWDTWTDAQKEAHVQSALSNGTAVTVGTNRNNNVVAPYTPAGEGSNAYFDYLYFTQINAGSYGVILVGAKNQNFQFSTYYVIKWTIAPKTLSASVSNATELEEGNTTNGTYFGDKNYGGIKVNFSGIIAGDSLSLGYSATFNGNEGEEYFRYSTLTSAIQNDNYYYLYGKYHGNYSFVLNGISENDRQTPHAHNSVYGAKDASNYTFDAENHAWTINQRPLQATASATTSFIYNGTAQGITVTISNLYAENFNQDVAYSAMLAEITKSGTITFTANHTLKTDSNTQFTVNAPSFENGTFTFTFTTINAEDYLTSISDVQYNVGTTDYDNYSLTPISTEYKISAKTIRLNWVLQNASTEVVADASPYSVEYNKTAYTMVASFQTTGDYAVYSGDYDPDTGKIAIVNGGEKTVALVHDDKCSKINAGEYTAGVNQLPAGNYVIAETGEDAVGQLRTVDWEITRKLLTEINFGDDAGTANKIYDGSPLSIEFTLPGLIQGDTIEKFGIFDGQGLDFDNDGVSFSLSAIDAGVYNLVLNVVNKDVDENYRITYSCNYQPFLTINKRVLEFSYPKTTAEYTASPITDFIANPTNLVTPQGEAKQDEVIVESYTYTLISQLGSWQVPNPITEIVNASTYRVTVASIIGARSTNYTLSGATTLSADCTVTPKVISLPEGALSKPDDNTYNGTALTVKKPNIYDYLVDGTANQDKTIATNSPENGYTFMYDGVTSAIDVGSYTASIVGIKANKLNQANYVLAQTLTCDWSIVKKVLTIEWSPFTTYYYNSGNLTAQGGQPESGNGKTGSAPFEFFYNGEGLLTANTPREVGVSVIIKEGIVAGDTVKIALVEANAGTSNIYYSNVNSTTYTATNAGTLIAVSQDNSIRLIAVSCDVNAVARALTIKIYDENGDEEKNYDLIYKLASEQTTSTDFNTCYYSLSARPVTLDWKLDGTTNYQVVYDTNSHEMTADIVGTVDGVNAKIDITGDTQTNAGEYTAYASSENDSNHVIKEGYEEKAYTINPKPIYAFSWDQNTYVYDALEHTPVATVESGATADDDGKVYTVDFSSFEFYYSGDINSYLVGDYRVTLKDFESGNYVLDKQNIANESGGLYCDYSITARPLQLTWVGDSTYEYNASPTAVYATVGNLIASDFSDNVDVAFNNLADKTAIDSALTVESHQEANGLLTFKIEFNTVNVGNYGVSLALTATRANCYFLEVNSKEWSITPVTVEIKWSLDGTENTTVEYSGTEHKVTATVNNLCGSDTVTVTLGGTYQATAVGDYTAIATALNSANYVLPEDVNNEGINSFDWAIVARQVDAQFGDNIEFIYNGHYQHPDFSIDKLVASDSVYFKLIFTSSDNTTATIILSGSGNTEYAYQSVSATIDADSYKVSFDGNVYSDSNAQNINANYTSTGAIEKEYEITQKTINGTGEWYYVSTSNATPTQYTASTNLVYSQDTYTLNSALNSTALCVREDTGLTDTLPTIVYTDNAKVDAGDYVAKMSFTSQNYKMGLNSSIPWKIAPLGVTINWTVGDTAEYTKVYAGMEYVVKATLTGVLNGDSCAVNLSTEDGAVTVATYPDSYKSTVASLSNGNYVITDESSKTLLWQITPRVITVSWDKSEFEYDGTLKTVTPTITNRLTEDEVVPVYINNTATNAGTYRAEITSLTGAQASYYTIEGASSNALLHVWVISKRLITMSMTTLKNEYNGQNQGVTLTVGNFITPDEQTITLSAFKYEITTGVTATLRKGTGELYIDFQAKNAGVYNITINSFSANNYYFTPSNPSLEGGFEISKRELTISTWNYFVGNESGSGVYLFPYLRNAYTLTPVVANVVEGETVTLNVINNSYTNAGKYTAVASLNEASYPNYKMTSVNVNWEIEAKEVALSWSFDGSTTSFTTVYDGDSHQVSATATNVIEGDTAVVYIDNGINDQVGNYTASARSISNANYRLPAQATKDYSITQREVTVSWKLDDIDGFKVEYDGEDHTIVAILGNIASVDNGKITPTYQGTATATEKGSYEVSINGLSDSKNYKLPSDIQALTCSWEITAVILSITFTTADDLVYNGSAQGIKATIGKIASADLSDRTRLDFTTSGTAESVSGNVEGTYYVIYFNSINAAEEYTASITALSGSKKDNYTLPATTSGSYKIAPLAVSLTWSGTEGRYDKQQKSFTATVSNLIAGNSFTLTYKTEGNTTSYQVSGGAGVGNVAINADKYLTTVESLGNTNYTLDNGVNVSKSWEITAKRLTDLTWSQNSFTYDGESHSVSLTVGDGATDVNDGKLYDGDLLNVEYVGAVTTDYGLSSISANVATDAGVYSVTVANIGNTNYYVENVSTTLTIAVRTLNAEITYTTGGAEVDSVMTFVYSGELQGATISISNLIAKDNNATAISLNIAGFSGTVGTANRTGTSLTQTATSKQSGDYSLTGTLGGNKSANYQLSTITLAYKIVPREITTQISADITAKDVVYDAEAISDSDLQVTFNNLATGESLSLATDFSVAYKQGGVILDTNPVNVGTYVAVIALSDEVTNYVLTGTTEFTFKITEFIITPDLINWKLNGMAVDIDSLTFEANEAKTITAEVNSTVFNAISGKSIAHTYFGYCSCGVNVSSASDLTAESLEHQHLLSDGAFQTTGPLHAGTYWVTLALSGADSQNFKFANFDGYSNADYFKLIDDESYLVWKGSEEKAIALALPELNNLVTAQQFGVARKMMGSVLEPTPDDLHFNGTFYTPDNGLPYVSNIAEGTTLEVSVNGKVYAYEAYEVAQIVKDAGVYEIRIYDTSVKEGGQNVEGCDLFTNDAKLEHNVRLTVNKAKVTVTSTSTIDWNKEYDKLTLFEDYEYATDVTFELDQDGNVISDGVLTGTDLTMVANFIDWNAGQRALTFTLSGLDKGNYYLVFDGLSESDYTVNELDYVISEEKASISPRVIVISGKTDKEFDGTTDLKDFQIVSQDIIAGDSVTVNGAYAGASVGEHAITITTTNTNYVISTMVAAYGTISPKQLNVTWTGNGGSYVYDKQAHGVTLTVSGMVDNYLETLTVASPFAREFASETLQAFTAEVVGAYTVELTLTNGASSNYVISETDDHATFTITQKELTVTWVKDTLGSVSDSDYIDDWTDYSVTFAGVERSVTPEVSGIIDGDQVTYTVQGTKASKVGTYTSRVSALAGEDKDNYKLPSISSRDWSITKATILGITFEDATYTYNASTRYIAVSGNKTQHGVSLTVVYSGKATEPYNGAIDAGVYSGITATLSDAEGNYEVLVLTATLTINKADIEGVEITAKKVTYDSSAHAITVSKTTTQFNEDITVVYSATDSSGAVVDYNNLVHAGEYTITASLSAGDNYNELTLASVKLTIDKKALVFEWSTTTAFTYNTASQGVTLTVSGVISGDSITLNGRNGSVVVTQSVGGTAIITFQNVNAATYTAEISEIVHDHGNNCTGDYALPINNSLAYTIVPKSVNVVWSTDNEAQNGAPAWQDFSVVYSNQVRTVYASVQVGATSADDGKAYGTVSVNISGNTASEVGDYQAVVSSLNDNNYVLSGETTKDYHITKATITNITFADNNVTFNGDVITMNVSGVKTQYGEEVTVNYHGAVQSDYGRSEVIGLNQARNAGIYSFTATIAESKNYNALTLTATLTINKATITGVSLQDVETTFDSTDKSVALSDNFKYGNDTDVLVPSYTISGKKADGTVVASQEGNSQKDAGVYTVVITIDDGYVDNGVLVNANYEDFTLRVKLTIKQAEMTFTTKTVSGGGTYVYDTTEQVAEITLVNASGANKTQYGDDLTVSYSGGQNGTNGSTDKGTYTVRITVDAGNNYVSFEESAIVVINAKPITVNWVESTYVYTGDNQTSSISATLTYGATLDDDNKVYDADKDKVVLTYSVLGKETNNNGDVQFLNAGKYQVSVVTNNQNYTITSASTEYEMQKATIDWLYFNGYSISYDAKTHYVGISETAGAQERNPVDSIQLLRNDLADVTYHYNVTGADDAYTDTFNGAKYANVYYVMATVTERGSLDNYNELTLKTTLTITPTDLKGYGIEDKEVFYNGSAHSLTINASNANYVDGKYLTQYGEELTLTYYVDGVEGAPQRTLVKIVDGAVASYEVRAVLSFSGANASELTASYNALGLTLSANLKIKKAVLTGITLNPATVTYDGQAHALTPSFTAVAPDQYPRYEVTGNSVNVVLSSTHLGDTFTVTATTADGATSKTNAGTYQFTVSISADDSEVGKNYELFGDLSAALTINKAKMANASGAQLVFDTNLFFEDVNADYTSLEMGILLATDRAQSVATASPVTIWYIYPLNAPSFSGDEAKVSYTYNGVKGITKKNAGTYIVTVTIDNANYDEISKSAVLTINKAGINFFFVGNDNVDYDGKTHYASVSTTNAYNPDNVTTIDLVGNDKATVSYTYTSQRNGNGAFKGAVNADVYQITAKITVIDGADVNYTPWADKTVSLTIKAYEVQAQWLYGEFVYNGVSQAGYVNASFATVDGASQNLVLSYEGLTDNAVGDTVFKDAGKYKVTADYDVNEVLRANYDISDLEREITIAPYELPFYFIESTYTYSASTVYLLINKVNAANVSDTLIERITIEFANATEDVIIDYEYTPNDLGLTKGARNVGIYSVKATLRNATESNYVDWSKEATLHITQKTLTPELVKADKNYDGSPLLANTSITLDGIYEADRQYLSHVASYDNKNVGTDKIITVTLNSVQGYEYLINNYYVDFQAKGTITARKLIPSASYDWHKTYDGTAGSKHNPINNFEANADPIVGDSVTVNAVYNSQNVLEANTVKFELSGLDFANYVTEDLSFTIDPQNKIYLISPNNVGISWPKLTFDYTGTTQVVEAYVSVLTDDLDLPGVSEGKLYLTVTVDYVEDSYGNEVSVLNTTFRNAGKYLATAENSAFDENMKANYGITANQEYCTINVAQVEVEWSGLTKTFVYNGEDQADQITVTAKLLGDDKTLTNYLQAVFGGSEFKDAKKYTFNVEFIDDVLNNNYRLNNDSKEITMEQAEITNVYFQGSESWIYHGSATDATVGVYYYFVTNALSSPTASSKPDYSASSNLAYSHEHLTLYYQYDATLPISIIYTNGEIIYSDEYISGAENGIRNAGARTITATILPTQNYKGWSGEVKVTVGKAEINNVYLNNYSNYYSAGVQSLYASNDSTTPATSKVDVYLPDGSLANVQYAIVGDYYNDELEDDYAFGFGDNNNSATDAGIYAVEAKIETANYYSWSQKAFLEILKYKSKVVWRYGDKTTANYVYNGEDQTDTVTAHIVLAGNDDNNRTANMAIDLTLKDEYPVAELKKHFAIAGTYTFVASFEDVDLDKKKWLVNNYELTDDVKDITMAKFTVDLKWLYTCVAGEVEYDEPCVYDKQTHGIRPKGIGLNGVEMDLIADGEFEAVNANATDYDKYYATVNGIKDGVDKIIIDGDEYEVSYETNYTQPQETFGWQIAKRPIHLELDHAHSYLSKVYDSDAIFDLGTATTEVSDVDITTNTVIKTITYAFTEVNYDNLNNQIVYSLSNIIDTGEDSDADSIMLSVGSAIANVNNVTAMYVTLTFDALEVTGAGFNYYIDSETSGIIYRQTVEETLIQPRRVKAMFKEDLGHVYNAKTFEKSFDLSDQIDTVAGVEVVQLIDIISGYNVSSLYEPNYFIGSFDIGGGKDVGEYAINATLDIVDNNGIHNYDFVNAQNNVIERGNDDSLSGNVLSVKFNGSTPVDYVISTRNLAISYQNELQSFNSTLIDVTGAVLIEQSDLTDMDWDIPGFDEMDESARNEAMQNALKAMLIAEGFTLQGEAIDISDFIINRWNTEAYRTYSEYTLIVGNETMLGEEGSEVIGLEVLTNKTNYSIDAPVLQLTYLTVRDASTYTFNVSSLEDLIELERDVTGLASTRLIERVGLVPKYVQTANISGILANGGYMPIVRTALEFEAQYNGNNYAITDLMLYCANQGYFGLFGSLKNATIENVTIRRVNLIGSNALCAGVLASTSQNSVIRNVNVSGTVTVTNTINEVYVGMLVGKATNTDFIANAVSGYVIVNAPSAYVGGLTGALDNDGEYLSTVQNNVVFLDAKVVSAEAHADYVIGQTEVELNDNAYLAEGIFIVNTQTSTNSVKLTSAQGEALGFSDIMASTDDLYLKVQDMVRYDLMRDYIYLPNGELASDYVVDISNYRQIALIYAYGWLDYNLIADVYIPNSLATGTREDSFYGEFSAEQDFSIYAMSELAYNLTAVSTKDEIAVQPYEKRGT
ncbi:MAG: hypothetical protein IKA77_02035 [Clostridia bacterium]|nr:hypothetical protein [Clostridia bacterium]